jgi:hypothetical protein
LRGSMLQDGIQIGIIITPGISASGWQKWNSELGEHILRLLGRLVLLPC